MNPLQQLHRAGQAVWLDFLRRGLVATGELERIVREDAVSGVTSNPTIFGKAIAGSSDYDEAIRAVASSGAARGALGVFYDLALADIREAADVLREIYDRTDGAHGFVSFELEPRLARDTRGSIDAAREIFARIGRPNAMIKVPGTEEGVPAVEELTAAGVNVNITLLFSVDLYEKVALAYVRGLERRREEGKRIDRIASVASFFVSRVDTAVDALLPEGSPLRGRIAVANAKAAYARFRELFSGERWDRLAVAGARVQRPLWASTGTKNPAYSDVLYVETLVGPDTVNTMPEATMEAFRDHGRVDPNAVSTGLEEALAAIGELPSYGVDLRAITEGKLVEEGIAAFDGDLQKLLGVIEGKLAGMGAPKARPAASLGDLGSRVRDRLRSIQDAGVIERIWRKDHTVWKPDPAEITNRLGWLDLSEGMRERVSELEAFARAAAHEGFRRAVLLGMGGSSLAPGVLRATFGASLLDLVVLDTTHPATIARLGSSMDLSRTLFVVASKSGTTVETSSHLAHFWERAPNGRQFVAITDPDTPLDALATERGFRAVFRNPTDVGGRYSALSLFGLVPGALVGADLRRLLESAEEMAAACRTPGADNPGAWLGAALGEAALAGRDKLTLVIADEIASLGGWIEQLVAESTGKEGKGILPVAGETLGAPGVYGADRIFVAVGDPPGALEALEDAGHPVVRLAGGAKDLGAELFRWEMATAVAGSVLGINAFDQPNVAEAKEATKRILHEAPGEPIVFDDPRAVLGEVRPGDYVSIQAYLDETPETALALERARIAIRDTYRLATTVGFGPRFLHSTGQLHKGGPDTGIFLHVVEPSHHVDVEVPGQPYTFGRLIDAQALGDVRSLRARGRRVARVTLEQLSEIAARR